MENSVYIANGVVVSDAGKQRADVTVEKGIITRVGSGFFHPHELPVIDAHGSYIVPGFLDIHTHGAVGVDVNAADAAGLRKIGRFFASQGTCGWLCSILTDTPEQTIACIEQAVSVIEGGSYEGAQLLGIHLEGPLLSSTYRGAMPESLLMSTADIGLFKTYQEAAHGHILYTTVAPEIPGVIDLIPQLNDLGITVALGHSGATYQETERCISAGAKSATHIGNAMRLFHQHEPAIFGAALESGIFTEMICDGRHLVPASVRFITKMKGWDNVIGITDSIMATGLGDGTYKLGVNDITVQDGDAKLTATGVRAGSTLTQIQALNNLIRFTGAPLERSVQALSTNPARLFGWHDRGRIEVGARADLVILDSALSIKQTLISGSCVFTRE